MARRCTSQRIDAQHATHFAMRVLLVVLLLASCQAPPEPCLLRTRAALTEGDVTRLVADGGVLFSQTTECSCVRDQTVTPGPADAAPAGYCAAPCQLDCGHACAPCPSGSQCRDLDGVAVCQRSAPPLVP
jgi:hypothetical protein